MFKRLAVATAAYVALELLIHVSTSLLRAPAYVFLLCHQLMEISVACFIGMQFRARPLNSLFGQMQQFGLQLVRTAPRPPARARDRARPRPQRGSARPPAEPPPSPPPAHHARQAEQLLPSVTTISINRLELSAPGMVEWSDKMEAPPEHGGADGVEPQPMTLIVVNPGGEEEGAEPGANVQTAVCAKPAAPSSAPSAKASSSGGARCSGGSSGRSGGGSSSGGGVPSGLSGSSGSSSSGGLYAASAAAAAATVVPLSDSAAEMPSLELMPTPPQTAQGGGRAFLVYEPMPYPQSPQQPQPHMRGE